MAETEIPTRKNRNMPFSNTIQTKPKPPPDIDKPFRLKCGCSISGPCIHIAKKNVEINKRREIEEKIEKANADLELLKSAYMNNGNNGTEDTAPTFKAFEEGSETMSKEANTQLAIRQEKFIRDLKNALIRIENKTYGVCRVTGNLINKKRLFLVPHATLSIEAKNMQK